MLIEDQGISENNNTVKGRLIEYLRVKRISKSEFGRVLGVSNAYVSSIRNSITPEKIQGITQNFPDLDIQWLMTGEGQMLKPMTTQIGNGASGIVIAGDNRMSNSSIDNRHCSDVLRAQIDLMEERLKEKDAQIKEKDAQIKQLLDIIQGMKK